MRTLAIIILLAISVNSIHAQNISRKEKRRQKAAQKAEQIRQIRETINSKNFIFKAETVKPINSKRLTLRSDFGIEIRGDSIFSYLPYFGNNYQRDLTSFKNSPLGFMLPIEKYRRSGTNEGYKIEIKIINQNEYINLVFHISKTGYTSLSASFLIRQSISFEGEILIPLKAEVEEK